MNLQSIKQRFGIIGTSELLDRALGTAIRVSNTDLSVLITGESGVGKEIFSTIIHKLSARKHNKFIAINCGAIPEGTINSELFGHDKGAFTGASGDRKGYFETVNGGTIFLDEIGEMPMDTQAFLLRILESGEFMRVGSSTVMKTDVRIVAATNVDLQKRISKNRFREDLFYRLNTVPIYVAALKERREDIHVLFRKFASDFAEKYKTVPIRLDEQATMVLKNYQWPGNIRELKNVAEQVSVLSEDRLISAENLIQFVPNILNRNLPALADTDDVPGFQEREILYKLLFEMKEDLNDLKSIVSELIQSNDLNMSDRNSRRLSQLQPGDFGDQRHNSNREKLPTYLSGFSRDARVLKEETSTSQPIIIDSHNSRINSFDSNVEMVEENLSLEDMEKEMIKKALKKHKNRRKDAAL